MFPCGVAGMCKREPLSMLSKKSCRENIIEERNMIDIPLNCKIPRWTKIHTRFRTTHKINLSKLSETELVANTTLDVKQNGR